MKISSQKIVFFHLLNNFTGSPKVLSQVIKGFLEKGYEIDLITNKTEGFLSNIEGVNYKYIAYNWNKNKIITLFNFIWAQIHLFCISIFKYRHKNAVFYINTLLPFGAAIGGKFLKKEVIYHVHEYYLTKGLLPRIYMFAFIKCAKKAIFVSNYVRANYITKIDSVVIYNTLDVEFEIKANKSQKLPLKEQKTILMISSLKFFKGIYQFIKLSAICPNFQFELVLSCSSTELQSFYTLNKTPSNLQIHSCQQDLHEFYQRAHICLNLSLPNLWIETFGLTILEAMAYGVPSIVPPVGGPTELINNNSNGFYVDSRDINLLKNKIDILLEDNELYIKFSENALLKSKQFSYKNMICSIEEYLIKS